jgi:glycosyltransferase involved in cell wall biosynthesis
MKVIEALAYGVPVVTTPAGMEGVVLPDGSCPMVVGEAQFTDGLTGLLRSPALREELGRTGRKSIAEHHSPTAAAAARLQAFVEVLGA